MLIEVFRDSNVGKRKIVHRFQHRAITLATVIYTRPYIIASEN